MQDHSFVAQGPYDVVYGIYLNLYRNVMYVYNGPCHVQLKSATLCMHEVKNLGTSAYTLCARHTFLFLVIMMFSQKNYIIINEYAQVFNRFKVSQHWWASRRPVTSPQSA